MTRSTVFVARRRLTCCLLAAVLLAGLCPLAWADPTAPSAGDRQVALAVTSLLRREHLLRHPLDKEISERCLKTFLKTLDPMKVYFYQSDVDEFVKQQDELADAAQQGRRQLRLHGLQAPSCSGSTSG